ncbi:hypothetical protein KOI35_38555 [Actinoplanes bogorensis]|uniref:Uncharacterized protein n=1 Tax=Paractinoplanes bogorensis TaxID=1610840 RepID=A0ABS5Z162_9ACTN|nr:hypothetical protein [Actinoplanes bogorensis]MBU2669431.1 hypothetical protein [Actinoplanes bogorensis]
MPAAFILHLPVALFVGLILTLLAAAVMRGSESNVSGFRAAVYGIAAVAAVVVTAWLISMIASAG